VERVNPGKCEDDVPAIITGVPPRRGEVQVDSNP
jgi:hypothetical protein